MKQYIILFFFLIFNSYSAYTQTEPVFTQYIFNQQMVNPSYPGIWDKFGFNVLVRTQWVGFEKSPLTELISIRTPTKNKKVGLGLNIIADQAAYERKLSFFGDYAYEVAFSQQLKLRLGFKFGFMNYTNPLTKYELYPDNKPDPAFSHDIIYRFLPNFGIGGFLYNDNSYFSFSIPYLLLNDLRANTGSYYFLTQSRQYYLACGYVITMNNGNVIKPFAQVKAGKYIPFQFDAGIHFMFFDQFWLGASFRSGDAICLISHWQFHKNMKLGFSADIAVTDILKHQYGTYEFLFGFDFDFFKKNSYSINYF